MSNGAGAQVTADGITGRPVYAYEPPTAFFVGPTGSAPTGTLVVNVLDHGAVADPAINNTAAIQAAIDAAHAAGGGIVYVPAGTYGIAGNGRASDGGVELKDNVFLKGDGMGATTLRVVDGLNADLTGIVRSPSNQITKNFGVADLTLDGNRDNNPSGKIDGFFCGVAPEDARADEDVYVLRVEAMNNRGYGFDPHEQTYRLSLTDSVAHHNGLDGFTEDFQVDALIARNLAYQNDRHGFNVVTTTNDTVFIDNVARDNGGAGITVQRGGENIPSPFNLLIQGGEIYGNAKEGILLQMSANILVTGVDVHDNGRSGIRIYGSSNVTIDASAITDNGRSNPGSYSEVQIAQYDDTNFAQVYGAHDNLIRGNTIAGSGVSTAGYGVQEKDDGAVDGNLLQDNVVGAGTKGVLSLASAPVVVQAPDAGGWFVGGAGADTLTGGAGPDTFLGDAGRDVLRGGAGGDDLSGGDGNDRLDGQADDDRIDGGKGDDVIFDGRGADSVSGGAGNDLVRVTMDAQSDRFDGGDGTDTLSFATATRRIVVDLETGTSAGTGRDTVSGFEMVIGGAAGDRLRGSDDAETLHGQGGEDLFRGRAGTDTMSGGDGADRYTWYKGDVISAGVDVGADVITDFGSGDRLDLRNLLKKEVYNDVSEVVAVTDTADGALVSVRFYGAFHDVVLLHGLSGVSAEDLVAADLILV